MVAGNLKTETEAGISSSELKETPLRQQGVEIGRRGTRQRAAKTGGRTKALGALLRGARQSWHRQNDRTLPYDLGTIAVLDETLAILNRS